MKHSFFCVLLMLLCLACNKEEELKNEKKSSNVTTRMAGNIDFSLSGYTVFVNWDRPFGYGIGISIQVVTDSGFSVGSFSSSSDSGSEQFTLYQSIQQGESLTAIVRGMSSAGMPGGLPKTFSLGNLRPGPDPTIPPRCNHSYAPSNPLLEISIDIDGNLNFYREFSKAGLLVYVLHVQNFIGYDQYLKPKYDFVDIKNGVNLPELGGNTSNRTKIFLPEIARFLSMPDATFSLEVRIYSGECSKLSSNSGVFPDCTNYCVYNTVNLEPLEKINRIVRMNQIRR